MGIPSFLVFNDVPNWSIRLKVAAICICLDAEKNDAISYHPSEAAIFNARDCLKDLAYGENKVDVYPQAYIHIEAQGQLKKCVADMSNKLQLAILNKELKTVVLRKKFDGAIDEKNTWLSLDDLLEWCDIYSLNIGEALDAYQDCELRIKEHTFDTSTAARAFYEQKNVLTENDYADLLENFSSFDERTVIGKLFDEKMSLLGGVNKHTSRDSNLTMNPKERITLLKIIGGLAIQIYKLNIHAPRLSGAAEMLDDLASAGVTIDPDTLSKHLKAASEVIVKPKLV